MKDFALFDSENHRLKWCQEIFGSRLVEIGIPAQLFTTSTSGGGGGVGPSILAMIDGNIDITQLDSAPGFKAGFKAPCCVSR